jgi:AcrR family transcriptional regulator
VAPCRWSLQRSGTGRTSREEIDIGGVRERRRARSRAATVDAALGLFAAHGYAGVTVADICTAAQIAPRTFFRYFASKEDVLAEPARDMAARLGAALEAAPAGLDEAGALEHALRELGGHVVAHRDRLAGFLRVAAESSALRSDPLMHLAHQERRLAEHLLARRSPAAPARPDWRTRLVVARAVAAFRVWLDDVVTTDVPDPLAHLDEVLRAG